MASPHDPQLTVSKNGSIRFGSEHITDRDLDLVQHTMWCEVNRLQWQFPGTSIWLVNETIHTWHQGRTLSFHWSEADSLREILK